MCIIAISFYWCNDTPSFFTWQSRLATAPDTPTCIVIHGGQFTGGVQPPKQFVPEIVSPLPCLPALVHHTLLIVYFFKELIFFIGSPDKCHASVFNTLILFSLVTVFNTLILFSFVTVFNTLILFSFVDHSPTLYHTIPYFLLLLSRKEIIILANSNLSSVNAFDLVASVILSFGKPRPGGSVVCQTHDLVVVSSSPG